MSAELWDILHDGVIEGVEGNVPGDVIFNIEIEYLRELFSDGGKNIIVRLIGCDVLSISPTSRPSYLIAWSLSCPRGFALVKKKAI
jgi:hypothetical protein